MAGTVSLFPVPGTIPPLAKACTFPPALNPLPPFKPPAMLPKNPNIPCVNLTAAIALIIGSKGFIESATRINAEASSSALLAIIWNVGVSVTPLTRAKNSCLTLTICTARDA